MRLPHHIASNEQIKHTKPAHTSISRRKMAWHCSQKMATASVEGSAQAARSADPSCLLRLNTRKASASTPVTCKARGGQAREAHEQGTG